MCDFYFFVYTPYNILCINLHVFMLRELSDISDSFWEDKASTSGCYSPIKVRTLYSGEAFAY